jgi:hypothetical protein
MEDAALSPADAVVFPRVAHALSCKKLFNVSIIPANSLWRMKYEI